MYVDNQWGYDVKQTNPFWIALYNLREVAKESVGEENVLDLSRGDPGYGFAPSTEGRAFYSYLLFIDTVLNNSGTHFVYTDTPYEEVMATIKTETEKNYSAEQAKANLDMLNHYIKELVRIAGEQGINYSERDVLFHTFKYASVSGGCYHDYQGEELCRAVVADFYTQELGEKIIADDLVFVRGVSDGIGTFFKLMGAEGIGFLKEGDTVLSSSPAYSPYNNIFLSRGLNVVSVSIDNKTGDLDEKSIKTIEEYEGRIKCIVLIDPNNPTGHLAPDGFKKRIVETAEKHNSIILTDEVYSSFFADMKSVFNSAKKRTLRINARSKIERSTGLRFGDYLLPEASNKFMTEEILADYLPKGSNLKLALMQAKAPGGIKGEFMHTTFVTGPSQFLGISHIIFGQKSRDMYTRMVREATSVFADHLGVEYEGNTYYSVFDMNEIASEEKRALPAEEKFYQLAKRGVVLIPAYMFYSEVDKNNHSLENRARACLPNLPLEKVKEAADITKEYLAS